MIRTFTARYPRHQSLAGAAKQGNRTSARAARTGQGNVLCHRGWLEYSDVCRPASVYGEAAQPRDRQRLIAETEESTDRQHHAVRAAYNRHVYQNERRAMLHNNGRIVWTNCARNAFPPRMNAPKPHTPASLTNTNTTKSKPRHTRTVSRSNVQARLLSATVVA